MLPTILQYLIPKLLHQSAHPISASALAERFSVTRQVIVGDIALLRSGGADILATPRGYCIQGAAPGLVRRVAVRHTPHRMETELNIMVDNGCTVVDVIVEHPLYGQLTGSLQLSTRAEVEQFMARSLTTQPLSALTGGIHLHTLLCPDEAAFQRVREALRQEDILLED